MEKEVYITHKDIWKAFSATLTDTSVEELQKPSSMKSFVQNESRLKDGIQISDSQPRLDKREVTLTFGILGNSPSDFLTKKQNLIEVLHAGEITLYIPSLGEEYYRLRFTKPVSYARSTSGVHCKMACKFIEANPANREKPEDWEIE